MTFHNPLLFSGKKRGFPSQVQSPILVSFPNQEAGGRKVTEKPPKAEAKADAKAERERETWMACDREKWGIHHASQFMTYGSLNGK
jgi:hypothetical protein